tara:strand:- start:1898 stop:2329 length:432 start_codon:yes stop_codon:yes gene_type:complete
MIQRREWTPYSQPGLRFVTEWDDSFDDAPHRCVFASRDGSMLFPPQVYYEEALRIEGERTEGTLLRSEEIVEDGDTLRVSFSISDNDGVNVFKDFLTVPTGTTQSEIWVVEDARYANWLSVVNAPPTADVVEEAIVEVPTDGE